MLSGYYKNNLSYHDRVRNSTNLFRRYPSRIPCILEQNSKDTMPDFGQAKFLIPGDKTFSEFVITVRSEIKLDSKQGLFFFVNNKIPVFSNTFSQIYNENKDKDGFLYIVVATENCFGNCR